AFNGRHGVFVDRGRGNDILGNSIHSNGGRGIVLTGGGNGGLPAPVLTDAFWNTDSVHGVVRAAPNTTYRLGGFASASCDPSGRGEGEWFLGSASVVTNAAGEAFFLRRPFALDAGDVVTATLTDRSSARRSSRTA